MIFLPGGIEMCIRHKTVVSGGGEAGRSEAYSGLRRVGDFRKPANKRRPRWTTAKISPARPDCAVGAAVMLAPAEATSERSSAAAYAGPGGYLPDQVVNQAKVVEPMPEIYY